MSHSISINDLKKRHLIGQNTQKKNTESSCCSANQLYTIDLSISLSAPYLIQGSEPSKYGLDSVLLRNHRNIPIISGSLLVGRIVEMWQAQGHQLENPKTTEWFGTQGVERGKRARIMVDDLLLTQIDGNDFDNQIYTTHRTRINEVSQTVEDGHLLMIEQIAAAGAELMFQGQWHVRATRQEMELLIPQLQMALAIQTQLGAYRNIGFGRSPNVLIDYHKSQPHNHLLNLSNKHKNTIQKVYRLALTTEQSICVSSKSRRGNVFESDSTITGSTILGTIATMLANKHGVAHIGMLTESTDLESKLPKSKSQLASHFSKIRCTHAFPTTKGMPRPYPLPQSLVKIDKDIVDAWQYQQPPTGLKVPPAFQTDWKDADFAKAQTKSQQYWGQLNKHLKVRTAIDKLGKAKDGSLFAYECYYSPFVTDPDTENDLQENIHKLATEWQFDLDLRQVDDCAFEQVMQELVELLSDGLFPVGKTDAKMTVQPVNQANSKHETKTALDSPLGLNGMIELGSESDLLLPIMLVTDALLFTTDSVISKDKPINLLQVYQNSFNELIEQSLNELNLPTTNCMSLHHFFATQKMVGGEYLYHRFQKSNNKIAGYQPWVMTESGSVFVFRVERSQIDNAKKVLDQWQEYGLCVPKSAVEQYGDIWNTNPFIRQNGYGEVIVNPQEFMGFELLSSKLSSSK